MCRSLLSQEPFPSAGLSLAHDKLFITEQNLLPSQTTITDTCRALNALTFKCSDRKPLPRVPTARRTLSKQENN